MREGQNRHSTVRPEVGAYQGVEVVESRLSSIIAFLWTRPSSDLALIGTYSCLLYVGGKLAITGQVWGAGSLCGLALLPYLLALRREDRRRAAQTGSSQPGDQLDS